MVKNAITFGISFTIFIDYQIVINYYYYNACLFLVKSTHFAPFLFLLHKTTFPTLHPSENPKTFVVQKSPKKKIKTKTLQPQKKNKRTIQQIVLQFFIFHRIF